MVDENMADDESKGVVVMSQEKVLQESYDALVSVTELSPIR